MKIVGIDPGQKGAFVMIDGGRPTWIALMPVIESQTKKGKKVVTVEWEPLLTTINNIPKDANILLERAVPFGMPASSCFTYGREFAMLEVALKLRGLSVTYIEPGKWTKVIHQGIDADLKPKAKSRIALERLFPGDVKAIPKMAKKNDYHSGVLDAFLIARYGERELFKIAPTLPNVTVADF